MARSDGFRANKQGQVLDAGHEGTALNVLNGEG
jgi:hypothetical protein